jgi:hypothetical protein
VTARRETAKPAFRIEKAVFGTEKAVFGTEKAVFGTEKALFGTEKALFRTEKALFRTEKALFRTEKALFGTEKALFGTEKTLFGTGKAVFGTEKAVWGLPLVRRGHRGEGWWRGVRGGVPLAPSLRSRPAGLCGLHPVSGVDRSHSAGIRGLCRTRWSCRGLHGHGKPQQGSVVSAAWT